MLRIPKKIASASEEISAPGPRAESGTGREVDSDGASPDDMLTDNGCVELALREGFKSHARQSLKRVP